MSSFDALGPSDATSVRVKIRVHPSGEHYVRVPKTVREAIARSKRGDRHLLLAMFDRNFGPWDEVAELHPASEHHESVAGLEARQERLVQHYYVHEEDPDDSDGAHPVKWLQS